MSYLRKVFSLSDSRKLKQEDGMPAKGRVEVNESYCKGCELCISVCPQEVLSLAAERITAKGYHPAELIAEGCTGCGVCALVCPEAAIAVYRETSPARVS